MSDFDEAACRARVEKATEAWTWHDATDDRIAGYGHHMLQMLYRLPRDSQTEDMRDSILALVADVPALLTLLDKARAELAEARAARDSHFAARNMLAEKVDRLEAQLAEVRRTSRVLPCDGLCSEYPEEDCSLHGREPAELWEAITEKNKHAEAERARADALAAMVERVKALADEYERQAGEEGYGGELWSTTAAALSAALAPADTTSEGDE